MRETRPQRGGGAILRSRVPVPVGPGFELRERYLLEEQVRRSRLGPIYRAVDKELSADAEGPHHVAVQVLPEAVSADERLLQRFKRDFLGMQSWSHPNIVRILAFEREQDCYFLITEYLEGESLRGILDELGDERISREEVLAIVAGVGSALGYAHSHGVVHGGVNAENVFITHDYEVKLVNFAPAQMSGGEMLVGSVDRRDDVRGLACLAYELLAGRHPFAAPGRRSAPAWPERPPQLTRRQWKAMEKALAPNRDQRFSTVAAFIAAFGLSGNERLVGEGGEPDASAATGQGRGRARRGRRGRWLAAALLLGAVAALGYLQYDRLSELVDASRGSLEAALGGVLRGREEGPGAPQGPGTAPGETAPSGPGDPSRAPAEPRAGEAAPAVEREPPAPVDEGSARAPGAGSRADGEAARPPAATGESAAAAETRTGAAPPPAGEATAAERAAPPPSPARFTLAAEQVTVRESEGVAPITIERLGAASGDAAIVWHIREGTAVAGEDYIDLGARTERFEDGETSRTVYVPLVVDSIPGEDKTFYVHIEASAGASLGPVTRTAVLIIDDS